MQGERIIKAPLGQLKLNHLVYFYMSIILTCPAYTYYMSVKHHQQKPFPHATVTATACHYPQDIVFRFMMGWAEGFLMLIFHFMFRWVETIAKKHEYPDSTYSYMYWPSMLSVVGYMIAIGTIDEKGTGPYHGIGAVYFFIVLYLNVVNITIVCYRIRQWDVTFMSWGSIVKKIVVATYLSIVWIYCIFGLLLQSIVSDQPNSDDIYIVIVQWNLVYAGLIWVLCFKEDWRNCFISLQPKQSRINNLYRIQ